MNDLPQNELFSAYLDGELTAAEQAEVERLLATSPAARQLLDELRTLSATLQALPQQKVGEDLSQRVLRVAERRMLTEGLDERENAPVPLERSVFRRFVNTRTLVWLGLTLAVALMITINDRRHRVPPAADAGKEVALAKREVEDRRRETSEPPSIHAPRSAATELAKEAKKADNLAEEKVVAAPTSSSPAGKPSVGARPFEFSTRKAADKDVAADGSALFAKPAVARSAPAESTTPAEAAAHSDNKIAASGPAPAKPDAVSERARTALSTGSSFGGVAGAALSNESLARTAAMGGRQATAGEKAAQAGEGMLVVQCNISPETARKQKFDKLLDANGIALQENSGQAARPSVAQSVANRVQQAVDLNAKQKPAANAPVRPAAAAGEVDFVYVEATPAQIDATLSGLWAQPDVFHSVSLNAEPDEAGPSAIVPEIVRQQLRANQVQGSSLAAGAGLATPVKAPALAETAKTEAAQGVEIQTLGRAPTSAGRAQRGPTATINTLDEYRGQAGVARAQSVARRSASEPRSASVKAAAEQVQMQPLDRPLSQQSLPNQPGVQNQQMTQSPARQRVLFVLRVVDGDQSTPPTANIEGKPQSDAAKSPSEPAAPPAKGPAQEK